MNVCVQFVSNESLRLRNLMHFFFKNERIFSREVKLDSQK